MYDEVYSSRIDIQGHPLEEADWTLYTDGSSYMDRGSRKAACVVVTLEGVVEAKALQPGASAQKAELITLMRVLELSQEKRVVVYTDSRYAFLILHAHGSIWKDRGLLTSNKKEIKHTAEKF